MVNKTTTPTIRCDFCGSDQPCWLFVSAFGFIQSLPYRDGGSIIHADDGQWAACELCAAHVERGDVTALVDRALEAIDGGAAPGFAELLIHELTLLFAFPMAKEPMTACAP